MRISQTPDNSSPGRFETGWRAAMSGVVLLIIGAASVWFYGNVLVSELEFSQRGIETDATLLAKAVDHRGRRFSYDHYSVTYRFTAAGQTVVRIHRVPVALWETAKEGAPLKVVYARFDPAVNRPVDASPPLDELVMNGLGVIMGVLGATTLGLCLWRAI